MSQFFQQIGYYLGHPEVLMYPVAGALLYPVLVVEACAMAYMVYEFGRFTIEMFTRDRGRSLRRMEEAAERARLHLAAGEKATALFHLGAMSSNWLNGRFVAMLRESTNLGLAQVTKILAETELIATRRLDRTRLWIRLGPIIGLMTTLIPLSPALVALGKGDMKTLSADLVLAFSTTIVGLMISGLAFVMSSTRERVYMQDIGDIEYTLELMEG